MFNDVFIVIIGLVGSVANNLDHIIDHMTYNRNVHPLVQIVLALEPAGLSYIPAVSDQPIPESLLGVMMHMVEEIFYVCSLIPRLSVDKAGTSFQADIAQSTALQQMRQEITKRILSVNARLLAFQADFQKYDYIWTMDKKAQLQTFFVKNYSTTLDDTKLASYGIPRLVDVAKIEDQVHAIDLENYFTHHSHPNIKITHQNPSNLIKTHQNPLNLIKTRQ